MRSALLDKLPAPLARSADSLIQIETRMATANVPPDLLEGIWREIALLVVERAPEEGLYYYGKVLAFQYGRNDLNEAGNLHLYMAHLYDEKMRKPEKVREHLMKAAAIWKDMGDEYKQAIVRQYEGVLEAREGRLEEGRQKVEQALAFFQGGYYENELLVGRCDLALVAHLAGQSQEGLTYLEPSIEIWTVRHEYPPLLNAINLKVRILLESGQLQEAIRVFQQNDEMIRRLKAPWPVQLTSLQLGRRLLQKSGRLNELQALEQRYGALTDSLRAERLVYFEE